MVVSNALTSNDLCVFEQNLASSDGTNLPGREPSGFDQWPGLQCHGPRLRSRCWEGTWEGWGGKLGRPQAWDGFKIGFEYGFLIWFNHVEWIENG